MNIQIGGELSMLLAGKAKREGKKISQVVYELLSKALWQEPEIIFKGKSYRIEPDLFLSNIPKEGEFEED